MMDDQAPATDGRLIRQARSGLTALALLALLCPGLGPGCIEPDPLVGANADAGGQGEGEGEPEALRLLAVHSLAGLRYGPNGGGDLLLLKGQGFDALVQVFFVDSEGSSEAARSVQLRHAAELLALSPSHPNARVAVVVRNAGGEESSLPGAYEFKGPTAEEIPGCALTWPEQIPPAGGVVDSGLSGVSSYPIRAEVAGRGQNAQGPRFGLLGEVGHGPNGTHPAREGAWRFFPAEPDSSGVDVPLDVYPFIGRLPIPTTGEYAFCFRFSMDGGRSWLYCDQSLDRSWVAELAGSMTVE